MGLPGTRLTFPDRPHDSMDRAKNQILQRAISQGKEEGYPCMHACMHAFIHSFVGMYPQTSHTLNTGSTSEVHCQPLKEVF